MDNYDSEKGSNVGRVNKQRIYQVIDSNLNRTFAWGEWDCCIFAMSCLCPDRLDVLVGQYDTEEGAIAKIDELGGLDQAVTDFGGAEVNINYVQSGDLIKIKGQPTLGIANAGNILCVTAEGMKSYQMKIAEKAWRFNGE